MGPLTNRAQYERVKRHIAQGRADGARLVAGGHAPDGPGYFIRPALFADVPADSSLWCEEIFGPVLCVRAFDTEDDAIAAANDTEYGPSPPSSRATPHAPGGLPTRSRRASCGSTRPS